MCSHIQNTVAILLIAVGLIGCSTVEKQTYFAPDENLGGTSGPSQAPCGFANFGGDSDTIRSSIQDKEFSASAYQAFHPYLFGPWFFSVIPVFPITWAVEIFLNDDLKIQVHWDTSSNSAVKIEGYFLEIGESDAAFKVEPSSVVRKAGVTYLKFPIDSTEVDVVRFVIATLGASLSMPLNRTSRWSWTQWTPNC